MACEQGAMLIVQYLVGKDPAVCRITLVDCKGKTPLHMAAKRNHAHVVSFLLEKVSPAFVLLACVAGIRSGGGEGGGGGGSVVGAGRPREAREDRAREDRGTFSLPSSF